MRPGLKSQPCYLHVSDTGSLINLSESPNPHLYSGKIKRFATRSWHEDSMSWNVIKLYIYGHIYMCLHMQRILIICKSSVLQSCWKHWINKYEPLLSGENAELVSYEPLVTTFPSTGQYVTLCYGCFCLKTPSLIHTFLVHYHWTHSPRH